MDKKTYREKLLDPRWQRKRLEILSRDNFQCKRCRSEEKTLHVHHINYKGSNPWDTPNIYLITMCSECHKKEEEDLRRLEETFVSDMRKMGATVAHFDNLAYMINCSPAFADDPDLWNALFMCIEEDDVKDEILKIYHKKLKEGSLCWQGGNNV